MHWIIGVVGALLIVPQIIGMWKFRRDHSAQDWLLNGMILSVMVILLWWAWSAT